MVCYVIRGKWYFWEGTEANGCIRNLGCENCQKKIEKTEKRLTEGTVAAKQDVCNGSHEPSLAIAVIEDSSAVIHGGIKQMATEIKCELGNF